MQYFTINMDAIRWASAWAANRKEKRVKIAFSFFNILLKQSTAVKPWFFSVCQTKRGEMEREGSWRKGGGKEERWRGCWHALVSNLFEYISQFICFVSTAMAEDNQTRRPLDSSYCPLPPPLPPASVTPSPCPPQHLFFHMTRWLKEKRGNSQSSPNGEMSVREPTSKPCCHGDTVQTRNDIQTHIHWLLYPHWLAQIHTDIHTYTHFS